MAELEIKSRTFTFFPSLPQELRDQIWREALPDEIPPALYFWRTGCWQEQDIKEADPGYTTHRPDCDDPSLVLRSRHHSIEDVYVKVPLASINREAREVALLWLREQGVEKQRDPLYIHWLDGSLAFKESCLNPNIERLGTWSSPQSEIRCLAVPLETLRWSNLLRNLVEEGDFGNLRKILVIVNEPLHQFYTVNPCWKVRQRYEVQSTKGGSFIWNKDLGNFEFTGSSFDRETMQYKLMKKVAEMIAPFFRKHKRSFELQPVFATHME